MPSSLIRPEFNTAGGWHPYTGPAVCDECKFAVKPKVMPATWQALDRDSGVAEDWFVCDIHHTAVVTKTAPPIVYLMTDPSGRPVGATIDKHVAMASGKNFVEVEVQ